MSELATILVVGGLLAGIGYAAWVLSRDAGGTPPPPETAYQHALHSLLAGDRDEALRAFTETVRQDSGNVDAYIHLANLLRERGDAARALHIRRELQVRSGLTAGQERAIREGLVRDLIALGRAPEAVEEAKALRDTDRKNGRSLRLLLKAHEAARDWERAFEARSEVAKVTSESNGVGLARYRSSIGEIYLREGKLDLAKRQFQAALKLKHDEPAALLRLGDLCYETNRPERAVVLWKSLAQAHPSFSHLVLDRLETSYFESGRFADVDRTYEEMLARNPNDIRVHLALARVHLKKGDLDDAGRMLNEALQIDPGSVPAMLLQAELHRRRGDLPRAIDEMQSVIERFGPGEVYVCPRCHHESEEYWSRCPECFAWASA